MKLATFNINNVNKRLPNLLAWLKSAKPDVVCLQELKAEHDAFPLAALSRRLDITPHGWSEILERRCDPRKGFGPGGHTDKAAWRSLGSTRAATSRRR